MRDRLSERNFPVLPDAEACGRVRAALAPARLAAAFALCVLLASACGGALAQTQDSAGAEMDRIAKENRFDERRAVINTKPFEDFTLKGKELFDQGRLNLEGPLDVTATAELNDDGTFKFETVRINWKAGGDENIAALAEQLVRAVSQSKLLGVLRGAKDARLALRLDSRNVSVEIASELPSEAEAAHYATGYGLLLTVGRQHKRGTDEGELYDGLKIANDGKLFVLSFEMRKDLAGKMLANMLAKRAARGSH